MVPHAASSTDSPIGDGSTPHHDQANMAKNKEVCDNRAMEMSSESSSSSRKMIFGSTVKLLLSSLFLLSAFRTVRFQRISQNEKHAYDKNSLLVSVSGNQNSYVHPSQHRRLLETSSSSTATSHADIPDTSSGGNSKSQQPPSPQETPSHPQTKQYSYMQDLWSDLKSRAQLFQDTPPEEVKYWFEYTGPLQKYFYRYSKSRGKADYFEGRDDSGVVSARFLSDLGGGKEHFSFYNLPKVASHHSPLQRQQQQQQQESASATHVHSSSPIIDMDAIPLHEVHARTRILEYCLKMGSSKRSDRKQGSLWSQFFGQKSDDNHRPKQSKSRQDSSMLHDRCRILIVLNTIGAGRGPTILWETQPPTLAHAAGPQPWMSEQETASTHLRRNLEEINAMCATGQIAIRLQVLVCEPIPGKWTDWMDALLPDCGGQPAPYTSTVQQKQQRQPTKEDSNPYDEGVDVDERPSPVQVVVVATASTADTCHDLKSGFMERRMQDLILAPPYLNSKEVNEKTDGSENNEKKKDKAMLKGSATESSSSFPFDPTVKTTHPDLVSSDDHDLYVAMKWSSLLTLRAVSSFLQASADIVAAAASPRNQTPTLEETADGVTVALGGPSSPAVSSPFLIPSFVRVSYVSEENNKVAKWRMHGDFFHPAAWEICKDSFDMTWIPHSLAGTTINNHREKVSGDDISKTYRILQFLGQDNKSDNADSSALASTPIRGLCYDKESKNTMGKRLREYVESNKLTSKKDLSDLLETNCGQWWIFMAEEQMPTPPEVFANEISAPLVQGGSNFFWMITERQRQEIVKQKVCEHNANGNLDEINKCGSIPQAVIPLGDMESFLINFTPNTALGKKHILGRTPGYTRAKERERDRELVRERKQLKGQEDIEKALFDYTVYPAALFRKDATLKAARARDAILSAKRMESQRSSESTTKEASVIIGPQTVKSSYYDVTITKPRQPVPGWCQAIARRGLCTLYVDYFRESSDLRCVEACGLSKDWSPIALTDTSNGSVYLNENETISESNVAMQS